MATEHRPPGVRVLRPYASVDALLEEEFETISRTGIYLLGAHARPPDSIIRFEVALTNGEPVLRGEGRVVAHKPDLFGGIGALVVRFTRIDSKTKALLDRAIGLRSERENVQGPSSSAETHEPSATERRLVPAPLMTDPHLPEDDEAEPFIGSIPPVSDGPMSTREPLSIRDIVVTLPDEPFRALTRAQRDALLERLRERPTALTVAQLAALRAG